MIDRWTDQGWKVLDMQVFNFTQTTVHLLRKNRSSCGNFHTMQQPIDVATTIFLNKRRRGIRTNSKIPVALKKTCYVKAQAEKRGKGKVKDGGEKGFGLS